MQFHTWYTKLSNRLEVQVTVKRRSAEIISLTVRR